MGETNNVFDQFPQEGMALKNELENWLSSTGAKIPEIDPLHNEEEEKEWLLGYKQKMKLKVEKRRAFQLDPKYLPNEDWWGSTID
jgi:predicted metal-dependent hydrolase